MIITNNDFQNKLGSDFELANSPRGPNVAWSRPGTYKVYRAGKFNNGVDIPSKATIGSDDYILGSGFVFNANRFITGIWTIPDTDVVNGAVQDTTHSSRHGYFAKNFDSNNNFMSFTSFGTDIGLSQFFTMINGVSSNYNITTGFNMTAGQLYHIMLVVDRDGIGATNETVRLYLNRVEIYSNSTVPANQVLTSGILYIGTGLNNGAFGINFQYDGVLDNIKDNNTFPTNNISERKITRMLNNNNNEAFPRDFTGVI